MNPNPIFNSATRIVLLMLTVTISSLVSYGAIFFTDERFQLVFKPFNDLVMLAAGAFFMKSSTDSKPSQTAQDALGDAKAPESELRDVLTQ